MRTILLALLVLAMGTPVEAHAGWQPSRRFFCLAGLVGGAGALASVFHRELDALWLGMPRKAILPEQLTFEGFSEDPLVNLRHKTRNLHGVQVTAIVEGPDAVRQNELGRFLTDFLRAAGASGQHPSMYALLPPRTVTVVRQGEPLVRYGVDTVRVDWTQGRQLAEAQRSLYRTAARLHQSILDRHGILLSPNFQWAPFEQYVAVLERFDERARDISRNHWEKAAFQGEVAVVDSDWGHRWNQTLPTRSVSLQTLDDVLERVRQGTFTLPAAPVPGP